jgi:hypothetical protein
MKPVCPKCQRFFRPKANGTPFIEMKPAGLARPEAGVAEPDKWIEYKLWMGDLWHCLGCGAEIIVGAGFKPISQDYYPDFEKAISDFKATIRINDC